MILARDEHREPLVVGCAREAPFHLERPCYVGAEALGELVALLTLEIKRELGAHEEGPALRVRAVLVGLDDVRSLVT